MLLCLDNDNVILEKDCFMPVRIPDDKDSAWEDAGDVCDMLNGTLATVDDDETMFKVVYIKSQYLTQYW